MPMTKDELAVGQTMIVHPMDARELQKKQNKKLQNRSFPKNETPVEPKIKTKPAPKSKHPVIEVDVKVKKQNEYKPW
jgi:hypothetical protein